LLENDLRAEDQAATGKSSGHNVGVIAAAVIGEVVGERPAHRLVSILNKGIGNAQETMIEQVIGLSF